MSLYTYLSPPGETPPDLPIFRRLARLFATLMFLLFLLFIGYLLIDFVLDFFNPVFPAAEFVSILSCLNLRQFLSLPNV